VGTVANVMRASGSAVPEWIIGLERAGQNEKKKRKEHGAKREKVSKKGKVGRRVSGAK
jgi:hypothetical protein